MNIVMPKRYLPYAILAGLVVFMALIAWAAMVPMRSAISGKMDDIQKFYTVRENRERQISRIQEFESQFQEIIAGEEALRILLSEDQIVDFVKTLENLASDAGVEIAIEAKESNAIIEKKPVKPATQSAADGAAAPAAESKKAKLGLIDQLPYDRYLHINVSLKGEYADIVRFLHKMETLPYALDVLGIDVRLNTDTEERGSVPESGRNPFMLVPSGNDVPAAATPDESAAKKQQPIEADIDTAVYIKKS